MRLNKKFGWKDKLSIASTLLDNRITAPIANYALEKKVGIAAPVVKVKFKIFI
jgi:hypothetical protein